MARRSLFVLLVLLGVAPVLWAAAIPTCLEILSTRPAGPVWKQFFTVCGIPRPSKGEGALRKYLQSRARHYGFPTSTDGVGNLVIRVPASPGCARWPTVICQAHLDMVGEEVPGTGHDFSKDPICPRVDGEWVAADRTTLGADNGLGVAALMVLMETPGLRHGPLELLFTVDEEGDFTGACGLETRQLTGRFLINLDSEERGELNIGCAGGRTIHFLVPRAPQSLAAEAAGYLLTIDGLTGGHSGVEIQYGRANALVLFARTMRALRLLGPVGWAELEGGTVDTTIPRHATGKLFLPVSRSGLLRTAVARLQSRFKKEFAATDPELRLTLEPLPPTGFSASSDAPATLDRLMGLLLDFPAGVQTWNEASPDLPSLSANPGVLRTATDSYELLAHLQSNTLSGLERLTNKVTSLGRRNGAKVEAGEPYLPWPAAPDSFLVRSVVAAHQRLTGRLPRLKVVHAGLECGEFARLLPEMQMVSFGPEIRGAHTPEEKVRIDSVDDFWRLLLHVLENLKAGGE